MMAPDVRGRFLGVIMESLFELMHAGVYHALDWWKSLANNNRYITTMFFRSRLVHL